MRSMSAFHSVFFALLLVGLPAAAEGPKFSRSPRELGTAVLRELSIGDGKIGFRVDSGGCTDAKSFEVHAEKKEGIGPQMNHYEITIERARIDECKALLWDGVEIVLDLEKDLGLSGRYTIAVMNPVLPKGR